MIPKPTTIPDFPTILFICIYNIIIGFDVYTKCYPVETCERRVYIIFTGQIFAVPIIGKFYAA